MTIANDTVSRSHEPPSVIDAGDQSVLPMTPSTGEGVEFIGVTKRFPDGTRALRPTSFSVRPGELVSIVGPSGCGKSTLLRIASGLTKVTSGEVRVDATHVGYVFQDASLLPWRTVRRNVELYMEFAKIPRPQRRAIGQQTIDLVDLTGSEQKYPRALSGGMKMRTSLARALTMSPDVMLFDEPFASLDEITRQRMGEELLRLFHIRRFAALFVTHSISEAVFLSSRVIVMSGRPGTVVADIDVPFAYPRPAELRYSPEFAEISARASEALKGAHS